MRGVFARGLLLSVERDGDIHELQEPRGRVERNMRSHPALEFADQAQTHIRQRRVLRDGELAFRAGCPKRLSQETDH